MLNDTNRIFETRDEAQRVASFYNMGSDYSTAVVSQNNDGKWIIKII